jgi:hypothetical protein
VKTTLNLTIIAASLSLPAIAQPSRAATSGTLIEFDAPGAGTVSLPACAPNCGTIPQANNALGQITGYYTDANIVPHGFLRKADGTFLTFDAPGAGLGAGLDQGTVPESINDFGVIAGQFQAPNYVFHGFIRDLNGSFTTVDVPGAGTGINQGTLINSLNVEGTVAGAYTDANYITHGFVRTPDGKITTFDPPGSVYTYVCLETCINASSTTVGFWSDANQIIHGFIRDADGNTTVVDGPGAYYGTVVASIDPQGGTTGYTVDANGVSHGLVRTPAGEFTQFDVLQAAKATAPFSVHGTTPFSINVLGMSTGSYFDENNVMHGFTRMPNGDFVYFDAPDAGRSPSPYQGPSQGTRVSTNNAWGAVTGWYVDTGNLSHGFVWEPN